MTAHKEDPMNGYVVTVEGSVTEKHLVKAVDAETAMKNWADGLLLVSEAHSRGAVSAREVDR